MQNKGVTFDWTVLKIDIAWQLICQMVGIFIASTNMQSKFLPSSNLRVTAQLMLRLLQVGYFKEKFLAYFIKRLKVKCILKIISFMMETVEFISFVLAKSHIFPHYVKSNSSLSGWYLRRILKSECRGGTFITFHTYTK